MSHVADAVATQEQPPFCALGALPRRVALCPSGRAGADWYIRRSPLSVVRRTSKAARHRTRESIYSKSTHTRDTTKTIVYSVRPTDRVGSWYRADIVNNGSRPRPYLLFFEPKYTSYDLRAPIVRTLGSGSRRGGLSPAPSVRDVSRVVRACTRYGLVTKCNPFL